MRQIVPTRGPRWPIKGIAINTGTVGRPRAISSGANTSTSLARPNLRRPRRHQHEVPSDLLHLRYIKLWALEQVCRSTTNQRISKSRGTAWEYVYMTIIGRAATTYSTAQDSNNAHSAVDPVLAVPRNNRSVGFTIQPMPTHTSIC